MLQSCQSTQASLKGCTFPLLRAKLGEKVWEKESWSWSWSWGWRKTEPPHSLPSQQADRAEAGKVETFPLALSSPPPQELSGHETVSRHCVWWHNILSLHPTHHGTGGEGTGGLGMPSAASAQLGLCLLEWETVPCPQGTVRVSKAETLHSYEGTSGINNQCQQRNSKGNVPLQQISTYVPHEKVSPLFLNGNNKKVYLILPEQ